MSLIRMSLSGAVMILVIVVIRALLLHKLPKRAFLFLWGVVLARLLIPYTLPCSFSAYSLLSEIGAVETVEPAPPTTDLSSGNAVLPPVTDITPGDPAAPFKPNLSPDSTGNVVNTGNVITPAPEAPPENALPFDIGTAVWIAGMAACTVFFTVSYIKCRIRFRESLPVESPRIAEWLSEHKLRRRISVRRSDRIAAPLTYGILRPVILLPKNYEKIDPDDLGFVLAHEYVHIRRFDAVFKILLTAAVCVHWFNPLVWVMYVIANKDIEISCDEAVIKTLGEREKQSYALTLIRMEEIKSGLTPLISHYSKNSTKERIVSIMKFKKATVITILASVLIVAGTVTAFATSAQKRGKTDNTSDTTSDTNSDNVSDVSRSDTPESNPPAESDNFPESEPAVSIPNPSEPPLIDLGDGVKVTQPLLDKSQYVEFSLDPYLEGYVWGEEEEKFLDSLGIPEIKSLYMRAQKLCNYLSTTDLPWTEVASANERKWHDILRKDGNFYGETGYTYDSVYNAYLSAFTEETTKEIFKNHDFLNYNGGFFCQLGAKGGNAWEVHREYELVSRSDTVIEFRRTTFSHDIDFKPSMEYDPALRDQYDKEYIDFKFVKTENGWRAEKFLNAETMDFLLG